jgi:ATP-dependent Clp protease ATP-binding subunit ClpB
MRAQWQRERALIASQRAKKAELETARGELERQRRAADYARASELEYGTIPRLERELAEAVAALTRVSASGGFLREEVTEDDIASVVAKWTGIPVEKMLEARGRSA